MMRTFAVASLAAAMVSAEAAPGSAVQKVIQLLDELKAKVSADVDGEKSQMAEYSTWCDDTITQAGFDIETASKQIEALGAVIEENTGIIAEMEATLQEKGAATASAQQDLAAAKEIRTKENEEFVAAEKELVEAVDMLARAHSILQREMSSTSMSLIQGGKKNTEVINAVKALSAIVNAAWMDPKAAKKVNSFLSMASAEDDDDLSLVQQKAKQPAQAAKYSYEGHSDAILETIDDMKDKAEEELGELRKAEMNTKHNFEMLKQSLTDSITNLNKEVDVAQKRLGEAGEAKGKAEGEKASTESSKAADEELKATTQSSCDAKAAEWDARQKSAADEIVALTKAKEILSSGVKAMFIQTASSGASVKAVSHVKNDSRSQLVRLLKKMGRQYNSFGLMQIANKAKSDPFVKVRGLIENMISKLEQEAQEEATHDAFCKEETSKSTSKRDELANKADGYQARMDKTSAAIAGLSNEVAGLSKDLSDMQKAMAEATELRNGEHSAYTKASTDYKESAEAVAKAVSVLREFYGSAALLQMGQPEFGSSKSDSGNSIIAFLETAEQDFSRLLAEEETSEEESLSAYNKYMQESKVTVAKKTAEKAGKESEIKSLKVALGNHKEDFSSTNKELDAVMEYLAKLKEQCTSKAHTYEERKAKREAEMEGLKQALDILSGDAPALLQTSKAFMARK